MQIPIDVVIFFEIYELIDRFLRQKVIYNDISLSLCLSMSVIKTDTRE